MGMSLALEMSVVLIMQIILQRIPVPQREVITLSIVSTTMEFNLTTPTCENQ